MKRLIECKRCHKLKEVYAKEFCKSCYNVDYGPRRNYIRKFHAREYIFINADSQDDIENFCSDLGFDFDGTIKSSIDGRIINKKLGNI